MAEMGPLSNTKLGNKYQLGELLGFGGFGEVYKAEDILLKRPQAIKVILDKHLSKHKFRERFIREAQTLAALNHPHILHVDGFEIEQERAYLVLPFISGGTLHSIMKARGRLTLEETAVYLKQICAALDYAHARNVVHLDLKPQNLLHQDGMLLLSDFGLAHLMKEGAVEGGTSLHFVCIPHARFIHMLTYKAQLVGIQVILTEESYTSKCSFLDMEPLGKHEQYMGKRMKRGLFRASDGRLINADVNGAYNIIRKVAPDAFAQGSRGCVVHPR